MAGWAYKDAKLLGDDFPLFRRLAMMLMEIARDWNRLSSIFKLKQAISGADVSHLVVYFWDKFALNHLKQAWSLTDGTGSLTTLKKRCSGRAEGQTPSKGGAVPRDVNQHLFGVSPIVLRVYVVAATNASHGIARGEDENGALYYRPMDVPSTRGSKVDWTLTDLGRLVREAAEWQAPTWSHSGHPHPEDSYSQNADTAKPFVSMACQNTPDMPLPKNLVLDIVGFTNRAPVFYASEVFEIYDESSFLLFLQSVAPRGHASIVVRVGEPAFFDPDVWSTVPGVYKWNPTAGVGFRNIALERGWGDGSMPSEVACWPTPGSRDWLQGEAMVEAYLNRWMAMLSVYGEFLDAEEDQEQTKKLEKQYGRFYPDILG